MTAAAHYRMFGHYNAWANAWLYDPAFSIKALTATSPKAITVRTGGDGFNCTIPMILSGVGNIINATMNMDISIAALSN